MPSKITFQKALERAVCMGVYGALSAFAIIPVDLSKPEIYAKVLTAGMFVGFLGGLQKFVKGYFIYDKK